MYTSLQFWPKLGQHVSFAGADGSERFILKDLKPEFPCAIYIIKSTHLKETFRAIRHQLSQSPEMPSQCFGKIDNYGIITLYIYSIHAVLHNHDSTEVASDLRPVTHKLQLHLIH